MPVISVEPTDKECLSSAPWSLYVSDAGRVVDVAPAGPPTVDLVGRLLSELVDAPSLALIRRAARRAGRSNRVVACGVVHGESAAISGTFRAAVSTVQRDKATLTLIQLAAETSPTADKTTPNDQSDLAQTPARSEPPVAVARPAVASRTWADAIRLDPCALARSAEDGLCCVDASGQLIFANEQWAKMVGSIFRDDTPASLVIDGDDDTSEQLSALLHEAIAGTPVNRTLLVRPAQAPDKWLSFSFEAVDTIEGPLVYVGAHDQTALREADGRFRRAIEGDGDGIFDWDFQADRYFASSRYWQLIGRPDEGPFGTSVDFFRLIHPDDVGRVQDAVQRHIDGETEQYEVAYRLRHPDGHYEWMESRGRIAIDAVGKRRHFAGSVRSIQRQKDLEESLRQQVRQRDRFLATLSHELRNPLGAITNALSVLELDDHADDETSDCLSVIRRQTEHVSMLLNDLLDVARISQNKLTLKRTCVNLADVVEHVVQDHHERAAKKHLTLSSHTSSTELTLVGDHVRITQCVDNLVTNAIKYTPTGGRIDIHLERDGDYCVVRVADTGIGLTEQVRSTVFEMFVQAKQSIGNSDGGIGVGLALVRLLTELHGGTITAESAGPNQGSVFELRLPIGDLTSVIAPPQTAEQPEDTTARPPSEPQERRGPIRIVLIDDLPAGRDMLALWLKNNGFEVATAEDGHTGLSAVDRFRPDAVLIDIGLPDMPGHDVARELRACKSTRDLPLIAVTGYGQDRDASKAEEAGFDAHFSKPVNLEELRSEILERVGHAAES